ncbi:unnamed protein product [Ixodes pacificus]
MESSLFGFEPVESLPSPQRNSEPRTGPNGAHCGSTKYW